MVARGMSSKEIAIDTGLSPRSVDTYLTDAMAVLGASNRREAARIFARDTGSQESRSQPEPLAGPSETPADQPRAGWPGLWHMLVPIPVGGSLNSLNVAQKMLMAARVGITGVVLLLAILTVFMGLLTVF